MVIAEIEPRRLVFVDEMGVHTSLAPLYGYSQKGERVRRQVPRNRGRNTTLLASMSLSGMGEAIAVEGSTNKEVFEAYIGHALAPMLEAGQVVVMDNLSAHKPVRVRELIEGKGCKLIYLPAQRSCAGFQSDRRSVQQDKGYGAQGSSPHEGCPDRDVGRSAICG